MDDLVLINGNIFLFINPNKLFPLLNKKDIELSNIKSYEYGIVEPASIDKNSLFLSPELKNQESKYIYYTCAFYSLAKILLHIFDLDLSKLYYTNISFFVKDVWKLNQNFVIFVYMN